MKMEEWESDILEANKLYQKQINQKQKAFCENS